MSSENVATEAHCNGDKCPPLRSARHFNKHHLVKVSPPENEPECMVCRMSWDTIRADTGTTEICYQVRGIECRHYIGSACLYNLGNLGTQNTVVCPLCRCLWFHCYIPLAQQSAEDMMVKVEAHAKLHGFDLETTRYLLWHEPELDHVRATYKYYLGVRKVNQFRTLWQVLEKETEARRFLHDLRDRVVPVFHDRNYDRYRNFYLLSIDIFDFDRWQETYATVGLVLHYAASSNRGRRLREALEDFCKEKSQGVGHSSLDRSEAIKAVETQWFEGRFSEPGQENFVHLLLLVFYDAFIATK